MSEFREYTVFEDEEFKLQTTVTDTAGTAQDISAAAATFTVRGPYAYSSPALLTFTSASASANGSQISLGADGVLTVIVEDDDMGVVADGLTFQATPGFRTARAFFQLDIDSAGGSGYTLIHGHLNVVESAI